MCALTIWARRCRAIGAEAAGVWKPDAEVVHGGAGADFPTEEAADFAEDMAADLGLASSVMWCSVYGWQTVVMDDSVLG